MRKRKTSCFFVIVIWFTACTSEKFNEFEVGTEAWEAATKSFINDHCGLADQDLRPSLKLDNELLTSVSDQIQFYLERRVLLLNVLTEEMNDDPVDIMQVIEFYEGRPKYIISLNDSEYYVIEFEGWSLKNNHYTISKSNSNYNDWFDLEKQGVICSNESKVPSGFWIVSEISKGDESSRYKTISVSVF